MNPKYLQNVKCTSLLNENMQLSISISLILKENVTLTDMRVCKL